MVRVSHDLVIIDLAERDIHGQLVKQGCRRIGGIRARIEGMHVAHQGALRMREIGDRGVRQRKARRGGVRVTGVLGQQIVRGETQQPHVAPDAGVKFLRVPEHERRSRDRIGIRAEIRNVRNPLLFVHDQILDDVQILGARLEGEMRRCVAIGAAVVHVDVHVAAPPAARREIVHALENDAACHEAARRYRRVGTIHAILWSVPNLDMNLSRRHGELGRPAGMKIRILELTL